MAEIYKQIKDFTLKNSIDGTEDILIQSNGTTMRIKSNQLKTNVDLSNYYTKSEVDNLLANIDVNIDMADYYDKATIDNLLLNKANVSHTHDEYISETELNEKGYATETYVQTKIAETVTGGTIDLSNYATKTELNGKADSSHTHDVTDINGLNIPTKISELQNDSGFISEIPSEYINETELNNALANKANTSDIPSLAGYATKDDLNTKADKSEIPSLEGYATETYVTNKIAEASLSGGEVDLSGLATKDELATKADKTAIPTKTSQLTNDSGFLTAHQDISNLALKSELHSHTNKTVLDGITSTKVNEWNNKSNFDGDYNSLTNKPIIPTVPTKTSELINDSGFITTIPTEYVTETELNSSLSTKANTSDIPSLTGYATETYVMNKLDGKSLIYLTQSEYDLLSDTEKQDSTKVYNITNATIDYSEISNTPTIPTKTSQLTNDSGFLTYDNLGVIKLTSPNGTKYKLIVSDDGSLSTELLETILCESISIDANSLTFTTSEPQTLNVSTVPSNTTERIVYSSNPTGIVNINNGVVTPISNGNCIITVTCGSQSATVSVSVSGINNNIPCTSISLNTNTLSFTTADNQTLTATLVPSNTTDTVLWSVSPEGIVSVSNGIVSPIANGSAVITATCGSQSTTCNVNVNIESGGGEGSTYVFDCTPQSGTGLVHPMFLFDVNNALSTDTFSLSMDIQPVSNVYGIQNGMFAVNDAETISDLTNNVNITKNCWVNNSNNSLISLSPTIPSVTTDGRYAHVLIKIKPTDTSSKVQFKISNVQFKVNDRIINVSGYGTYVSGDSITIE